MTINYFTQNMTMFFKLIKKNRFVVFQHGVGVEFVRFLPETHPPVLSNVFCELGVCENVVSITHILLLNKCVASRRYYTLCGTSLGGRTTAYIRYNNYV